jgi:hypothetical protein
MKIALFFDIIGRDETFSEHGFQVSGVRCQDGSRIFTTDTLYETSFQKLELVLTWATLHFVGWVGPTTCFVGFRCTQPNLHFAGVIANCETQQRPISEPSPKSIFFDQPGRFFGRRLG